MTSFQWPLRVYIEDTDAGGIVYYVNYLKFIERARTEYLRSIGFDKQFIFNESMMFVVHSLQAEYLRPARLDDALIATAELVKSGKSFLVMEQKVFRCTEFGIIDAGSELLCRAEVKLACVDQQSLKPKRMPAILLESIS